MERIVRRNSGTRSEGATAKGRRKARQRIWSTVRGSSEEEAAAAMVTEVGSGSQRSRRKEEILMVGVGKQEMRRCLHSRDRCAVRYLSLRLVAKTSNSDTATDKEERKQTRPIGRTVLQWAYL